jgi:hypothetical protein
MPNHRLRGFAGDPSPHCRRLDERVCSGAALTPTSPSPAPQSAAHRTRSPLPAARRHHPAMIRTPSALTSNAPANSSATASKRWRPRQTSRPGFSSGSPGRRTGLDRPRKTPATGRSQPPSRPARRCGSGRRRPRSFSLPSRPQSRRGIGPPPSGGQGPRRRAAAVPVRDPPDKPTAMAVLMSHRCTHPVAGHLPRDAGERLPLVKVRFLRQ